MLLRLENICPLPAVRGPERGEHHVGLVYIYFNDETPPSQAQNRVVGVRLEQAGLYQNSAGTELQLLCSACAAVIGSRASGAI